MPQIYQLYVRITDIGFTNFGLEETTSQSLGTFTKQKLSEGYNSKLGRKIKQHPNFYHLCGELKIELEKSKLDAMAAKTGNTNRNKNVNKKAQMLEKKHSDMREKLENGNVEMMIYQQS